MPPASRFLVQEVEQKMAPGRREAGMSHVWRTIELAAVRRLTKTLRDYWPALNDSLLRTSSFPCGPIELME